MKKDIRKKLMLYAVTDRTWLEGQTLSSQVLSAIEGGVSFVQLREKNICDEEYVRRAIEVKEITDRKEVLFVINDNVEVAIKSDADGVHLGQNDTEIAKARQILGEDKIIGATAHNVAEAVAAYKAGADYLGVGACFGSTTKHNTTPLSYKELCRICKAVPIPVVAIGGINEKNISLLSGSGISGAAIISGIFAAPDIREASEKLKDKLICITKDIKPALDINGIMSGKAAVFDMDGTILDSMPMWAHLASDYIKKLGKTPNDDLDFAIKTMTIYEAADFLVDKYKLDKTSEEVVDDVMNKIGYEYANNIPLKAYSMEYIKRLKEKGVKVAVATATEYNLTEKAMKRTGLYPYLDAIVTCTMAGSGKETPAVYEMACEKMMVDTNDAVIYEDAIYAVTTAKKAGFKVAAVFDEAERINWCDIVGKADYCIRMD